MHVRKSPKPCQDYFCPADCLFCATSYSAPACTCSIDEWHDEPCLLPCRPPDISGWLHCLLLGNELSPWDPAFPVDRVGWMRRRLAVTWRLPPTRISGADTHSLGAAQLTTWKHRSFRLGIAGAACFCAPIPFAQSEPASYLHPDLSSVELLAQLAPILHLPSFFCLVRTVLVSYDQGEARSSGSSGVRRDKA
jgi:hypothetical protein